MIYFDFTKPWALVFLLFLLPVLHWYRHSRADIPPVRRKIILVLRSLLLIALVFALAGFKIQLPNREVSVLFVVDSSLSVSAENKTWAEEYIRKQLEAKPARDKAGVILFGKDACLEENLSRDLKSVKFSTVINPDSTDIAGALQLASAVFPEGEVKRIVLISDGNENLGNTLQQASLASSGKIEINTLPFPQEEGAEVLVRRVEAPSTSTLNDPFAVRMEIDSTIPRKAILKVFRNDELIAKESVDLNRGKNLLTMNQQIRDPGSYRYRASIEASGDQIADNNECSTIVLIRGVPRVLLLTSSSESKRFLGSALEGQKIKLDIGDFRALPSDLAALSGYQAVIFDNISGLNMPKEQMLMIENYVRDIGGGFIMIGGDNSFGAGGYYESPVERILPVDLDVRKRKSLPSIALILCIDKSGSMSESVDNSTKMRLAVEAAIASVEMLTPKDKVGVIGFDSAAKWVVPMQYVGDGKQIISDIATMQAGGGTSIYPSLVSALNALKGSQSAVKHVVVLTDGRSEPGDFKGIIKELVDNKITVSTVGVGNDTDIPFLRELADMGKGRFYFTDKANFLPRIFVREVILVGRSTLMEELTRIEILTVPEFHRGVDLSSMPPLEGYVVTTPKEQAVQAFQTHQKDPLLAYWRIGLGKSIAFTSDDGLRWAKDWLHWENYRKFWSQAVRWSLADPEASNYPMITTIEGTTGHVLVEAVDGEGIPKNFLHLKSRIISPSGKIEDVELRQTQSGRYEGTFTTSEIGTYFTTLLEKKASGNNREEYRVGTALPVTLSYSQEFSTFNNNVYLLERIARTTGGRLLSPDDDVFQQSENIAYIPRPAWIELLLAVLLLFPLDVALRRVYLPDMFLQKTLARFGKLFSLREGLSPTASPESVSSVTRLKTRKEKIREAGRGVEVAFIKEDSSSEGRRIRGDSTLDVSGREQGIDPDGSDFGTGLNPQTQRKVSFSRQINSENFLHGVPSGEIRESDSSRIIPTDKLGEESTLSRLKKVKKRVMEGEGKSES